MANKLATPAVKVALILTLLQVALFIVVIAVYGSKGQLPFLHFQYGTTFAVLPANIFIWAIPIQAAIAIPVVHFYRRQFGLSWDKCIVYFLMLTILMSFMVAGTIPAVVINEKYLKKTSSLSSVELFGVARSKIFTRYGTSRLFCAKMLRISLQDSPDDERTLCVDTLLEPRVNDIAVGTRIRFEALQTPYGYLLTSISGSKEQ